MLLIVIRTLNKKIKQFQNIVDIVNTTKSPVIENQKLTQKPMRFWVFV